MSKYNPHSTVSSNNLHVFITVSPYAIGHNYNLKHSSDSTSEYGDKSGMMGFSYKIDDGPAMCFNGPKSWQLGWYSDGHITIHMQSLTAPSFSGFLIGVNNYEKNQLGTSKMIIKLHGGANNYFVMFNLARGINSGVVEGKNKVMVTSQPDPSSTSIVEAELSSGEEFSVPYNNYFIRVSTINFAASVPYAEISVGTSNPPASR